MPLSARARNRIVASVMLAAAAGIAAVAESPAGRTSLSVFGTWVWELRYEISPVAGDGELAALHASAGEAPSEQCIACHGDKSGSALPVHLIHLRSRLLRRGLRCHECHPRVDLTPRSSTVAATWVDVAFCKKCHSAFPGTHAGSPMSPGDIDADCTGCHEGDRAPRHAPGYIPRVIAPEDCRGCHGGRALPWTAAHEADDWLAQHGGEALRSGADSCNACHDFGLKFCDECHANRPSSHLPKAEWLDAHPGAARADTRVCYSCHTAGDCRQCHVDHEEGWLASHPARVAEKGDDSCAECHSDSSCGFCHARAAAEGAVTP